MSNVVLGIYILHIAFKGSRNFFGITGLLVKSYETGWREATPIPSKISFDASPYFPTTFSTTFDTPIRRIKL